MPYFFQHLRADIATTDDGHAGAPGRQLAGVENESGDRDSATGLRHRGGIAAQILNRMADFVLGHGDDIVHIAPDVLEIDRTDALRAESVGDGA